MEKFYGIVGFETLEETRPSVFVPQIVERHYPGDVLKNYRRTEIGDGVNDNMNLNNEIRILADAYAREHFHSLRYIKWYGGYWKITSVTPEFPRLRLTIGGVYNGPTAQI